jgi:hypothetical protein
MIKVFKLTTGEELISTVTSGSEAGWHLEDPAMIMIQRTQEGMGVALAPFLAYTTGKLYLHKSGVIVEAEADTQMQNEYNRLFGSGIVVAPASALVRP